MAGTAKTAAEDGHQAPNMEVDHSFSKNSTSSLTIMASSRIVERKLYARFETPTGL